MNGTFVFDSVPCASALVSPNRGSANTCVFSFLLPLGKTLERCHVCALFTLPEPPTVPEPLKLYHTTRRSWAWLPAGKHRLKAYFEKDVKRRNQRRIRYYIIVPFASLRRLNHSRTHIVFHVLLLTRWTRPGSPRPPIGARALWRAPTRTRTALMSRST